MQPDILLLGGGVAATRAANESWRMDEVFARARASFIQETPR